MNLPFINKKIEIVKDYQILSGKITIGLDKFGNIYARCNQCKVNIPVLLNIDNKAKKNHQLRKVTKCHKCGILAYL